MGKTSGVYCQAAKADQAAREQVSYSQKLYLTSFSLTTANNLQELPSWELNTRARAKKDCLSLVFPTLWKSSRWPEESGLKRKISFFASKKTDQSTASRI